MKLKKLRPGVMLTKKEVEAIERDPDFLRLVNPHAKERRKIARILFPILQKKNHNLSFTTMVDMVGRHRNKSGGQKKSEGELAKQQRRYAARA